MNTLHIPLFRLLLCLLVLSCAAPAAVPENYVRFGFAKDPYHFQVDTALKRMESKSAEDRAEAVQALSFLRAYGATDSVAALLKDSDSKVRREAVMNMGWTGGRKHLKMLVEALKDADWSVRQAAAVALFNMTGMEFPFDGLAVEEMRAAQAAVWANWVEKLKPDMVPEEIDATLAEADVKNEFYKIERSVRALGALGGKGAAERIPPILDPILAAVSEAESVKREGMDRDRKLCVQACIRALGRLGGVRAKSTLIRLLDCPQWAPYAAEALGNAGGQDAAAALLAAYPQYARNPEAHIAKGSFSFKGVVEKFFKNDGPELQGFDCLPVTAHQILRALCLIDFKAPENRKALEAIVPSLVATTPNQHDATIVYNVEPWQMLHAWFLEKAGVRQAVVDAAFAALGQPREVPASLPNRDLILRLAGVYAKTKDAKQAPYAGVMLSAFCRSEKDLPLLFALLDHPNGFVRIEAARALKFMGRPEAVAPLMERLEKAPDDASFGYCGAVVSDEYNDPCPRWKEAFLRALGDLNAPKACPLLVRYLNNGNNSMEIQYAAALALQELGTPEALEALKQAELTHPFHSVRMVARQALKEHALEALPSQNTAQLSPQPPMAAPTGEVPALVFFKADHQPPNHEQIPSNLQGYTTTDAGPTYRWARNIYKLSPVRADGKVTPLTQFKDGYVADLEVSYDGNKLLFCHREEKDPWWHVFELNADGSGLRQITNGPYHDIQPNYMPDGRIVFATSRIGVRDEYHGYPSTALATMNADGSDIRFIGLNLGRDAEPVVSDDGRILFTRLELFYSRLKTEWNLLSVLPDGTHALTLYGPERRAFWQKNIVGGDSLVAPRHRVLRITQPQPFEKGQCLINSFSGPMLTGPGRMQERILQQDNTMAITTPYPLGDGKLLVAAGPRPMKVPSLVTKKKKNQVTDPESPEFIGADDQSTKKNSKPELDLKAAIDYGLYTMDVQTGKLTLIYNDPATSEFEARPLQPRKVPPIICDTPAVEPRQYSGKIYCQSVFSTQEPLVKERGRYVRIVEGLPTVARHQTHVGGVHWKNHGGAVGKVLGMVPLAADGSFSLEVPADRLFHLQVLDSDRQVLGNELLWQYVRPGETKGCIGCHEQPDAPPRGVTRFPAALKQAPLNCMPTGEVMRYHAKAWFKGSMPSEREERMRTVNSVNLLGTE